MLGINAGEKVKEGSIYGQLASYGHEQLVICYDEPTGLKAIIGIHNTVLGPALGGCRLWNYASEAEAITDVLRLSRGMTFKAAISGLNLGGGKAVLIGDPQLKTEAYLRRYGNFIESLGGKYMDQCHKDWVYHQTGKIYDTCFEVLTKSASEKTPAQQIAIKMAQERIMTVGKVKLSY